MCISRIHVKQSKGRMKIHDDQGSWHQQLLYISLPWTCWGGCPRLLVLPCPSILCRKKRILTDYCYLDCTPCIPHRLAHLSFVFHSLFPSLVSSLFLVKVLLNNLKNKKGCNHFSFSTDFSRRTTWCYLSTRSSISMNKTGDEEIVRCPWRWMRRKRRIMFWRKMEFVFLLSHVFPSLVKSEKGSRNQCKK